MNSRPGPGDHWKVTPGVWGRAWRERDRDSTGTQSLLSLLDVDHPGVRFGPETTETRSQSSGVPLQFPDGTGTRSGPPYGSRRTGETSPRQSGGTRNFGVGVGTSRPLSDPSSHSPSDSAEYEVLSHLLCVSGPAETYRPGLGTGRRVERLLGSLGDLRGLPWEVTPLDRHLVTNRGPWKDVRQRLQSRISGLFTNPSGRTDGPCPIQDPRRASVCCRMGAWKVGSLALGLGRRSIWTSIKVRGSGPVPRTVVDGRFSPCLPSPPNALRRTGLGRRTA